MELVPWFHSLTRADIERFVSDGQEEHLHLDFKMVKGASLKSDDDKRNLARALSGFANSSGGLIVWGIDARKGADGIDRAQGLVPIDPVQGMVARLNELTGSYVEPLVDGVEHRSIIVDGTAGYAITLVPESFHGPHMAKAGEDRYFKRSGDSFYRMEHFDIADMFGRRQKPELEVIASFKSDGSITGGGGNRHRIRVIFSVMNIGRGSAQAPYLGLRFEHPYRLDRYGVDGNRSEGLPRLVTAGDGRFHAFGGTANRVIHPGTQQDVCAAVVEVVEGLAPPEDMVVRYVVAAQDMRQRDGTLRIPGEDLANAVSRGLPPAGS